MKNLKTETTETKIYKAIIYAMATFAIVCTIIATVQTIN